MGTERGRWTGYWIIGVGVLHSLFGFLVYSGGWAKILERGIWNSVDGELIREHAFWFTVFGFAAILIGSLMVWIERQSMRLPRFLGWSFVGTVVVVGLLMPVSGFWLLLPPGIAILRRG